MCADFFSIDLNTVDYAGALNDPVAATVFCAPQKAHYTVIDGRVVVEDFRCTTIDESKLWRDAQQMGEAIVARSGLPDRSKYPCW